jgi:hypothetical protein
MRVATCSLSGWLVVSQEDSQRRRGAKEKSVITGEPSCVRVGGRRKGRAEQHRLSTPRAARLRAHAAVCIYWRRWLGLGLRVLGLAANFSTALLALLPSLASLAWLKVLLAGCGPGWKRQPAC